jgi:hypothetical protein
VECRKRPRPSPSEAEAQDRKKARKSTTLLVNYATTDDDDETIDDDDDGDDALNDAGEERLAEVAPAEAFTIDAATAGTTTPDNEEAEVTPAVNLVGDAPMAEVSRGGHFPQIRADARGLMASGFIGAAAGFPTYPLGASGAAVTRFRQTRKTRSESTPKEWTNEQLSVVLSRQRTDVTRRDIDTLLGDDAEEGAWLTDSIVDVLLALIVARSDDFGANVLLTNSWHLGPLHKKRVNGEDGKSYVTRRFKNLSAKEFGSLDIIVMPYNENNKHWFPFVLFPKSHEYICLDPFYGDHPEVAQTAIWWHSEKQRFLNDERGYKFTWSSQRTAAASWTRLDNKIGPKQSDNDSCGVFMMLATICTVFGLRMDYTMSDMKRVRRFFLAMIFADKLTLQGAEKLLPKAAELVAGTELQQKKAHAELVAGAELQQKKGHDLAMRRAREKAAAASTGTAGQQQQQQLQLQQLAEPGSAQAERSTTSAAKKKKRLPMSVIDALVSKNVKLKVEPSNPKRGASAARYELYKEATDAKTFILLGGSKAKADLQNDIVKGLVTIDGHLDYKQHPIMLRICG